MEIIKSKEEKNNLVSIIVPIFNTEKYLDRCIKSILSQSYSAIELILINDGSTDSSSQICKKYCKQDKRVRYYEEKNSGQGAARNLGLDVSVGNFVLFVDSDDYIENNTIRIALENINKYGADISSFGTFFPNITFNNEIKIYNNEEIMLEHLKNLCGTGQSPCDKLFRKELFKKIRFKNTRAYEDCATIYKLLSESKICVYQNTPLYHYEKRENSTMTQKFGETKFLSIYAYLEMKLFYHKNYKNYEDQVDILLLGSIKYFVGEACKDFEKYKAKINEAKKILKESKLKCHKLKNKIEIFCIKYLTKFYGLIYRRRK